MNRIHAVLNKVGYTVQNLEELTQRCPGSYIEGMPKAGDDSNNCTCVDVDCTECWEKEAKDEQIY